MEEQTILLLKECSSGCKMATQSIRQVREYAKEDKLERILDSYDKKHRTLEKEIRQLLENLGKQDEEPSVMAELWAKMDIEMKMMVKGDHHQIAKLMMDGCHMGIKTVSEQINKYSQASHDSVQAAQKLVKIEEDFMKEMKEYL